jgi:ParB-like chromosome segregation protein Spo0J
MTTTSRFRPLAKSLPAMEGDDFDALIAEIKAYGLRDPIVRYQGKIVDGRNHFRACELTGVKPKFTDYSGNNALDYVVSRNVHRRHVGESQRIKLTTSNLQEGERE